MVKVTVAGESVVITSAFKLDDYKLVAKYRPEKLVLKSDDDGKEPVFAIGITKNAKGSINNVGAEFGGKSHDGTGRATITMDLPSSESDVKEVVAEKFGSAIIRLNKIEETLPSVIEEIVAEKNAVMESILVQ